MNTRHLISALKSLPDHLKEKELTIRFDTDMFGWRDGFIYLYFYNEENPYYIRESTGKLYTPEQRDEVRELVSRNLKINEQERERQTEEHYRRKFQKELEAAESCGNEFMKPKNPRIIPAKPGKINIDIYE